MGQLQIYKTAIILTSMFTNYEIVLLLSPYACK